MAVTHEHDDIWINAVGAVGEIRSTLLSAIRDEGWQYRTFTTIDAFLTVPPHPYTIVMLVIETFTIASLELVRDLAVQLGLPVVVFGLEDHPMMVRTALEAGADDVITTSSSTEETLGRLHAIVRVAFQRPNARGEQSAYHLDDIHRSVSIEGEGGT